MVAYHNRILAAGVVQHSLPVAEEEAFHRDSVAEEAYYTDMVLLVAYYNGDAAMVGSIWGGFPGPGCGVTTVGSYCGELAGLATL